VYDQGHEFGVVSNNCRQVFVVCNKRFSEYFPPETVVGPGILVMACVVLVCAILVCDTPVSGWDHWLWFFEAASY